MNPPAFAPVRLGGAGCAAVIVALLLPPLPPLLLLPPLPHPLPSRSYARMRAPRMHTRHARTQATFVPACAAGNATLLLPPLRLLMLLLPLPLLLLLPPPLPLLLLLPTFLPLLLLMSLLPPPPLLLMLLMLLLLPACHQQCSRSPRYSSRRNRPGAARCERARGWNRMPRFSRPPSIAQSLASTTVATRAGSARAF